MKYYIKESIDLLGEELITEVSSPAKKVLKNIDESSTRLYKKYADILNSIVSKLLWVAKGGRPNIKSDISFLCTRVTKSTKEDKEKFRRLFQYLKHTINGKSIMGSDSLSQLCT